MASRPDASAGSETAAPGTTAPGPATTPADAAPPADEPDVPEQLDFTATTVDGETFAGTEVAGQDLLVYFWAPWCTVCRATAPGLADFAAGRDDVEMITVGGSSPDVESMADFVADVGFEDFTNIADTSGEVWTRFGVVYQYTYAFVDDSGSVEVVTGPLDEDELTARFDALAAS